MHLNQSLEKWFVTVLNIEKIKHYYLTENILIKKVCTAKENQINRIK